MLQKQMQQNKHFFSTKRVTYIYLVRENNIHTLSDNLKCGSNHLLNFLLCVNPFEMHFLIGGRFVESDSRK